jgi:hypothetical protein
VANRLADKTKAVRKSEVSVTLKTGGKQKIAKTRGERAVQIGLADSVEQVEAAIGKEAAHERI